MSRILSFVFVFIGAGRIWLLKGAKTRFDSEMSHELDANYKFFRNLILGMAVITIVVIVILGSVN